MADEREWVVVGKVTSAHGIRGEIKVKPFVDDLAFLQERKALFVEGRPRREVELTRVRITPSHLILGIEGVEDRTEAERLRGRELSVPLEWLPDLEEDEFYVAEIVGLAVESLDGEALGTVEEVLFTGANEVYVVRGGAHGEILIPAIASVIQSVDLEAGRLTVILPEGLVG